MINFETKPKDLANLGIKKTDASKMTNVQSKKEAVKIRPEIPADTFTMKNANKTVKNSGFGAKAAASIAAFSVILGILLPSQAKNTEKEQTVIVEEKQSDVTEPATPIVKEEVQPAATEQTQPVVNEEQPAPTQTVVNEEQSIEQKQDGVSEGHGIKKEQSAGIEQEQPITPVQETVAVERTIPNGTFGGNFAGTEQYFENLCNEVGVEPRFAAAIVGAETAWGTAGVAGNNNPFSYRAPGDCGSDGYGFGIFSTPEAGLEAGIRNLARYRDDYGIGAIDIDHCEEIGQIYCGEDYSNWLDLVKGCYYSM